MTLEDILSGIRYETLCGCASVEVREITFDSRAAVKGSVFVAIEGTQADGHDFVGKAVENGCTAVVVRKAPADMPSGVTCVKVDDTSLSLGLMARNFYGNPTSRIKLVGVTGTNGKTTTATLLYEVFRAMGHKCGLLSTVKNVVDTDQTPARQTTPDILTINSLLSDMISRGCEYCFMEVSSHALVQKRVAGLDFAGAVFSNLTHDHLDYHKTFAAYRDAKKLLFDGLSPDAFALVNADDKNGLFMLQNTSAGKYTYALSSLADFKARVVEESFQGMQINMDGAELWIPLVGRFNAYNALAVYASAVLLGCDRIEALKALSRQKGVRGRFENWTSPSGVVCIVDYAHTPDALDNVIRTVNELRTGGELFTVVTGCGGDRDKTKRPEMAAIAANGADRVIMTADNPRSEDPMDILEQMQAGVPPEKYSRVVINPDRRSAIRSAAMMSKKGDIILVAGKGHETYQEVIGVCTHFDDMEELHAALSD